MTHKEVEDYIFSMANVKLVYPFGEGVAVYKVTSQAEDKPVSEKMFAIVHEGSDPVKISLKCDPQLAEVLREKYESVLPGYHLNKKHWNTIILTGQLGTQEIQDLIRHSYELVAKK